MAHIRICTPYYSDYNDSYKASMLRMSETSVPWTWEHIACQGVNPALSRNLCTNNGTSTTVLQLLDPAVTHYMYVDSDIEWSPEHITRLLMRDVDVVCGAYDARGVQGCWTGGLYEGVPGNPGQFISKQSKGLCQVDWCGAGFLLVRREVLEKMEYPWFRHAMVRMVEQVEGGIVYHQVEVEEDIGFCMGAKAAGYKLYIDCDVHTSHECDPMTTERCRPSVGRAPHATLSQVTTSWQCPTGPLGLQQGNP